MLAASDWQGRILVWSSHTRESDEKRFALVAARAESRLRSLAKMAARTRNWAIAEPLLRKLLESYPDERSLHVDLGRSLAAQGKYAEAISVLREALAQIPASDNSFRAAAVWSTLSLVQKKAGQDEPSRNTVDELIGRFSDDRADQLVKNVVGWSWARFAFSQIDSARPLGMIERAVQENPDNPAYQNTLGAALYRAGRDKEAIVAFDASIRGQNGRANWADCLFLTLVHHRLGNDAESAKWRAEGEAWAERLEKGTDPEVDWEQAIEFSVLKSEVDAAIPRDLPSGDSRAGT